MSRAERMYQKLERMSDHDILVTWNALSNYDLADYYDVEVGITMDSWAGAVYSEKGKRRI